MITTPPLPPPPCSEYKFHIILTILHDVICSLFVCFLAALCEYLINVSFTCFTAVHECREFKWQNLKQLIVFHSTTRFESFWERFTKSGSLSFSLKKIFVDAQFAPVHFVSFPSFITRFPSFIKVSVPVYWERFQRKKKFE